MNFREKSANFVSRLEYQEQEREHCAPIFSRVMDLSFFTVCGNITVRSCERSPEKDSW